jgi:hypothetical protein
MTLPSRILVELLRLAGLLGLGLSLLGLGILVWVRVEALNRMAPGGAAFETTGGMLSVLDAFKEAGVPFLLSAILFAVCEIALRPRPAPSPDSSTSPDT